MKKNKKITLTNIRDSHLYTSDPDFYVEYLRDKGFSYDDALNAVKNNTYNFTEEELEEIDLEKDNYYTTDFWVDKESLRDNTVWEDFWNKIEWTFAVNEIPNTNEVEIIFSHGVDWNWEIIYFYENDLDEISKGKYDEYIKLFDKFINPDKENDFVEESDFIDFDGSDWNAKAQNIDKPDYIIKYRGWKWYTYRFFEYVRKNK